MLKSTCESTSSLLQRQIPYWEKNPVAAWTSPKKDRRTWFRVSNERFSFDLPFEAVLAEPFSRLVRELVDYRLAQYRARRAAPTPSEGFVCRVTWNKRDPILKLPSRDTQALPLGEVDVRLADGSIWQMRFAKEFINVARPPGAPRNQLPDLLRRWFGPRAGHPGTSFQVRFYSSPDGLWVEPVQSNVVALEPRRGVVAYPDLRAAAGHAQGASDELEPERVLLPIEPAPELFAVRVSGTSMDGGSEPLRDGDWAILRTARGASAESLVNRVVLVQVPGEDFGAQYQIKRLVRRDGRWLLASDNPTAPPGLEVVSSARYA